MVLIVSSVSKEFSPMSMGDKFTELKYLLKSSLQPAVEGKKK